MRPVPCLLAEAEANCALGCVPSKVKAKTAGLPHEDLDASDAWSERDTE